MPLQAARQRQATPEIKTAYNRWAGIEGTLSQGIRALGLRHAPYRGQAKVQLQQVLTATALNLCRMHAWLTEQPRATTRQAAFVRLVKNELKWMSAGIRQQYPKGWKTRLHQLLTY